MNIFSLAPTSPASGLDLFGNAPAAEQASRENQFAACLTRSGLTGAASLGQSPTAGSAQDETLETALQAINSAREEFGLSPQAQAAGPNQTPGLARTRSTALASLHPDKTKASAKPSAKRTATSKLMDRLNPQQIKITAQDFAAMRQGLLDNGLSASSVKDLEDKALSHTGLTWGEFVHALSARNGLTEKAPEFSGVDRQNLSGLFSKLGFNPQETDSLIKDLKEKRFTGVMTQVSAKISGKTPDTYLSITPQELTTLASALNLSKDGTAKLAPLTSRKEALSLDEAKNALTVTGQSLIADATTRKASDQHLVDLVGQTLKGAVQAEMDRRKSERLGGDPQESRMRDSKGIGREIRKAFQHGDKDASQVAKDSPAIGKPGDKVADGKGLLSQAGTPNTSTQAKDGKGQGSSDLGQDPRDRSRKTQGSDEDKAWKEFLSRLRLDESTPGTKNAADPLSGLLQTRDTQATTVANQTANVSTPSYMRQIQDAAFKDLGQGTKQLTLQLQPEDMGTVNVVLQVKGKEVQAVISSENKDTVAVIHERLDSIRQALEDQGLKVDRLEVRSSLPDSQSFTQWSGAESHNRDQQAEAMSQWMGRLRSMRSGEDFLAQDMQPPTAGANLAQSGLHIIA